MIRILSLAFCAAIGLASCGTLYETGSAKGEREEGLASRLLGRGKDAGPQQVDVQKILSETTEPLAILSQEKTQVTILLRKVAQNGWHSTYASDDGQSLSLRRGIITATRGGGNDLMATELESSVALVSSTREGKSNRRMHYVNGDGERFSLSFDCEVLRGKREPFVSGLIATTTQLMVEQCKNDQYEFANTYLISSDGQVLGSRQWINPQVGSVLFQMIRR